MAVKIIRQQKKIALLGSPTSAAALRAGHERAPGALRAAGLAERLKASGFEVADLGDTATYVSAPDDEHPRARNVSAVLKSLNDLRPRVEVAVKSGALPVILSGDCISVLAIIAVDLLVLGIFTSSQVTLIVTVIVSGIFLGVNNTLVTETVMKVSPVERSVAAASYSFVRFMGGAIAPYRGRAYTPALRSWPP